MAAAALLYACSWVENFVVFNDTANPVYVQYTVSDAGGFPIFTDHPTVYAQTKGGGIDYEKIIAFADEDTARNRVSVKLPPNHAMIIGHLMNDKYTAHNQQFINGRVFNLVSIAANTQKPIIPSAFDTHFKKGKHGVVWRLK